MFRIIALCIFVVISMAHSLPFVDFRSPEEIGGHFEGDMELTLEQTVSINRMAGLINTQRRWLKNPTGQVIVPYSIQATSFYNQAELNIIRNAMNVIENNTCIRFIIRTTQQDFIDIFSGTGCSAQVGRISGRQIVSLMRSQSGLTCMATGIVIHELLHSLGLYHMQSSPDRDRFIRIHLENVRSGSLHNFERYPHSYVSLFGTSYDLDSIMHYSRNAFARAPGLDTIATINPESMNRIGQRRTLSPGDITRINNMYRCT